MNSTDKVTVVKEITEEEILEDMLESMIDSLSLLVGLNNPNLQEEIRADIRVAGYDFDVFSAAVYKVFKKLKVSDESAIGIVELCLQGTVKDVDAGLEKISKAYEKLLGYNIINNI